MASLESTNPTTVKVVLVSTVSPAMSGCSVTVMVLSIANLSRSSVSNAISVALFGRRPSATA